MVRWTQRVRGMLPCPLWTVAVALTRTRMRARARIEVVQFLDTPGRVAPKFWQNIHRLFHIHLGSFSIFFAVRLSKKFVAWFTLTKSGFTALSSTRIASIPCKPGCGISISVCHFFLSALPRETWETSRDVLSTFVRSRHDGTSSTNQTNDGFLTRATHRHASHWASKFLMGNLKHELGQWINAAVNHAIWDQHDESFVT